MGEWIDLAAKAEVGELPPIQIFKILQGEESAGEDENEKQKNRLQENLARLNTLVSLSGLLAEDIEAELENLNN